MFATVFYLMARERSGLGRMKHSPFLIRTWRELNIQKSIMANGKTIFTQGENTFCAMANWYLEMRKHSLLLTRHWHSSKRQRSFQSSATSQYLKSRNHYIKALTLSIFLTKKTSLRSI